MKRSVAYTIAGFAIINLILIIVSVATSAWLTFSGRGVFSLWQSGENVPSALKAVRAFMLLGLFVEVGGIVFCFLVAHQKTDKRVIGEVLFLVSSIFLFIAMVVFTVEFSNQFVGYGYSYVLGWIACVLSLILSAAVEIAFRRS